MYSDKEGDIFAKEKIIECKRCLLWKIRVRLPIQPLMKLIQASDQQRPDKNNVDLFYVNVWSGQGLSNADFFEERGEVEDDYQDRDNCDNNS